MTAIAKHRDLLSAGLALGFVVFVLGTVVVKTLTTGIVSHAVSSPAVTVPAQSESAAPAETESAAPAQH
jgi:hypothetical protein